MIRFLFLTLLLVVGALLALDWLGQHPGEVHLSWLGYEVQMHIAVLLFVFSATLVLASMLAVMLWQVLRWPERRRLRRNLRVVRRGLEQLTRGVTALSMGDEKAAAEAIRKALSLLPDEPLPRLMQAQLLQRQGQQAAAEQEFRALLSHKATAELATRRMIEQHASRGEWQAARATAEEALAAHPQDRWLTLSLLDLSARMGDYKRMLALSEGWQWQSPLSKEERHRQAALAYYLQSQQTKANHVRLQALRHAVGYAPEFLPATLAYAEALQAHESPRRARKFLLECWRRAPLTALIEPILETMAQETAPAARARLLRPFIKSPSQAAEYILSARLSLAAGDLAAARAALSAADRLDERAQGLHAHVLLAQAEGRTAAAEDYRLRRERAAANAEYRCTDCLHPHPLWQPHCAQCGHYDTLRPPTADAPSPSTAIQAA